MRSMILSFLLLSSAFLIRDNQSKSFDKLKKSERIYIRKVALNYVRFLLAQRVDPLNQDLKEHKSVQDLLKDEAGRDELKAIYDLDMAYINSTSMSTKDYYEYCKSSLFLVYQNLLSLGVVKKWPRYFYDQDSTRIIVLAEALSLNFNDSSDDYGPSVPVLENLKGVSEAEIMKKPADLYQNIPEWVPNTTDLFQNSGLYKLYHVIPLPALASFCKLFSAVWHGIKGQKLEILSASLRIHDAESVKYHVIDVAIKSKDSNFNKDSMTIGRNLTDESEFEFNIKKHILWAPGMLYYGFKNQEQLAKGKFDNEVEVIIGKRLTKFAENIHNRILDLLDQVKYSKVDIENVVEQVKSKSSLFIQMKEILEKLIIFGRTSEVPHQNNLTEWTQEDGDTYETSKWRINYRKGRKLVDFDKDERVTVADEINESCKMKAGVNRSIDDKAFKQLESFEFWSILTSDRDAIFIFRDFFEKYPNRASVSLTELRFFIRDEIKNYYLAKKCDDKSVWCSRVNALCNYKIGDYMSLYSYENGEFVDGVYFNFYYKKRSFVPTVSFSDWCSGKRFENPYQLTTDTAVMRVLTFDSLPNSLNEKIYLDLNDEFEKSATPRMNFPEYVNVELQKFNSTASRILNQACKIDNESSKTSNDKYSSEGLIARTCHSVNVLSQFACLLNGIIS